MTHFSGKREIFEEEKEVIYSILPSEGRVIEKELWRIESREVNQSLERNSLNDSFTSYSLALRTDFVTQRTWKQAAKQEKESQKGKSEVKPQVESEMLRGIVEWDSFRTIDSFTSFLPTHSFYSWYIHNIPNIPSSLLYSVQPRTYTSITLSSSCSVTTHFFPLLHTLWFQLLSFHPDSHFLNCLLPILLPFFLFSQEKNTKTNKGSQQGERGGRRPSISPLVRLKFKSLPSFWKERKNFPSLRNHPFVLHTHIHRRDSYCGSW